MKKHTLFYAVIALMLCAAMFVTGCSKAPKAVVAKVGDKEIPLTQLQNYYNNYSVYAAYYGQDISTEEGRAQVVEMLLDELIDTNVKAVKAKEAGIELTAEENEEAKKAAEADYDSFFQDYLDYAEQQGASDVKAQALKLLTSSLVNQGTTVKEIKNSYLESEIDAKRIAKHEEQILAEEGAQPTDEKLRAIYDEEVAAQTEALSEGNSAYFLQEQYAEYGMGYEPIVIPEGLFYVRHILVTDDAESGKTGEEIAKELKARIDAGEDFETLLAEYNTDTGEDAYPEGYVCGEGASFVTEFLDASLALAEGEVSEPVQSSYGYHIIKRLGALEARTVPFEELSESFIEMAKSSITNGYYEDKVAAWTAEEGLVTKFADVYASIIKDA